MPSVDGAASLLDALETAQAGETILLEPGDYGYLKISVPGGDAWGRFDGGVTIRSADPANPATFTGMTLHGVENLTVEGVVVDYETPASLPRGAVDYNPAVLVSGSAKVTFRNSVFEGTTHDNPESGWYGMPIAKGIFVRESESVVLEDNEFLKWGSAASFQNTSDIVVSGNDMHTLRTDGFQFVAVQGVVVEGNHLHDFVTKEGLYDHRDMIQFWTAGATAPTTDVLIQNNVLDSGTGADTQSIFMRNELVDTGAAGREMFYRNVVIKDNVIYNGDYHGITVGEADGLTIVNNTLLHNIDSGDEHDSPPRINVAGDARNVRVTHNIAEGLPKPSGSSVGWTVADNLVVQNAGPEKPNYYADLFINAMTGSGEADLAALQALPGGVVEKGGYGASLTRFDRTPETLAAVIRAEPEDDDTFSFDGGYTANPGGLVGTGGTFRWNFGDGTVHQGVEIDHTYAKAGTYKVTLTVTDADGRTDSALAEAYVPEPVRLDLDVTAGGLVDRSTYAVTDLPPVRVQQDGGRYAARLTDGTGFQLGRSSPIYDLDAFTISLDLKGASGAASAGHIFLLNTSLEMKVEGDGSFRFDFINDAGQRFPVFSTPTKALDGAWHTVDVTYDKADGDLTLYLDGAEIGQVDAGGSTKPLQSWGLNFGSIWGRVAFDGLLDDIEFRDEALSASEIRERQGGAPAPSPDPTDPPEEEIPGEPAPPEETPGEPEPPEETPGEEPPASADVTLIDFDGGDPGQGVQLVGNAVISPEGTLVLDGDRDYLALQPEARPDFTGAVSVAFDLRFDEAPGALDKVLLLSQHSELAVELRGGKLTAAVGTEGGGYQGAGGDAVPALTDGDWHRIALAVDSEADVLRLYLDGDLVVERTDIAIELSDSPRPLTFGSAGWNSDMAGEIDDVLVANAALDLDALM